MRELGKIILYLVATVVLGSLLAAPLYWGGQWLAGHRILTWLAQTEFRRFFHRGLLIAAIVLLWPLAHWVRLSGIRGLGLEPNPRLWQDLSVGFAASFLTMVALGAALVNLHVAELRDGFPWASMGRIAFTAVFVSVLEEWLFRGAILGLLNRSLPEHAALFATSALFSILHFLKPQDHPSAHETVGWLSGFAQIPQAFTQFSQPWLVLGGFTTLFCMGWIVGWTRLKTHSLGMAIGLHSGWILGLMGFNRLTRRLVRDTLPWFGENLSIGLCSVVIVLITGAIVWGWISYARPNCQTTSRRD